MNKTSQYIGTAAGWILGQLPFKFRERITILTNIYSENKDGNGASLQVNAATHLHKVMQYIF